MTAETFAAIFTKHGDAWNFWGAFTDAEHARQNVQAFLLANPAWKPEDFETRILPFGTML